MRLTLMRIFGLLALSVLAVAQVRTIGAETNVSVRTNERIDASKNDVRVFTGVVDQDVTDADINVGIPRAPTAELNVRKVSSKELTIDLESVSVSGRRYAVTAHASHLSGGQRDNIGKNNRTAERRWERSSVQSPAAEMARRSAPGWERGRDLALRS